ncbi:hypothetical protein K1719_045588 [Acacia pycnantha]|nr:hypothetical protein K1719_045588 [Acacia pycnantha]
MVDQWLEVEAHNFNDLCFKVVLQLVILPKMGQPGDLSMAHACEQKLEKVMDVREAAQREPVPRRQQLHARRPQPSSRDQLMELVH